MRGKNQNPSYVQAQRRALVLSTRTAHCQRGHYTTPPPHPSIPILGDGEGVVAVLGVGYQLEAGGGEVFFDFFYLFSVPGFYA